MVKIGDLELSGRTALAPMAGVSDFAFRHICLRLGAAYTVTEMVSAKALVYNDEKTKALLYIPEEDRPCGAQIFGMNRMLWARLLPSHWKYPARM